jgi:hypothetical protein
MPHEETEAQVNNSLTHEHQDGHEPADGGLPAAIVVAAPFRSIARHNSIPKVSRSSMPHITNLHQIDGRDARLYLQVADGERNSCMVTDQCM